MDNPNRPDPNRTHTEAVEKVAQAIKNHARNECWWHCDGGTSFTDAQHAVHVAEAAIEAYTAALTVTTVEQLDSLPDFVVLRDKVGTVWEKEHYGGGAGCWWKNGQDGMHLPKAVKLPALVLWAPCWVAVPDSGGEQ